MYSIFKKEIKTFLGSLIGYLVILVFLLTTGLFLWVFPGAYNIPENGYATLDGLFSLAPWMYLFLIPAITMRFFADEKRSGTIEILLTRPVSDFKIVSAKFLAGLVLVFFSLLPTLLYFLSVYLLGNPVGSIDTGATWGSFIGLFLLAAMYVSIGILASALTENQIVSFILAMVLSFVFYLGFEFIGTSGVPYLLEQLFAWMSINSHYQSISRGVVDLRDMVYFIGTTLLFLVLTSTLLRQGKWKMKKIKIRTFAFLLLLIIVFIVSVNFLYRIDLTADKRYSLSLVSKQLAAEIESQVEVEFFLTGELEPGLRKLQQEVFEKIAVLNLFAEKPIRLKVTDPYQIRNEERRNDFIAGLYQKGIIPTNFRQKTDAGTSTKLIFPGALIRSSGKETAVNFLKYNSDFTHEVNFNHSVENVEFELVNAIQKLERNRKSKIVFLEGHGEYDRYETADFSRSLSENFLVECASTQFIENNSKEIDILIIAGPKEPFPEKDKLIIDQFVMNGGKTVWLIDPVQVSLDSLSNGYLTYAFPRDLNLGDQLFKYGVRLNYELLQDVECVQIPVNTAPVGAPPKFTLHPWYYSPLLTPSDNHPLSRNLNRVMAEFVSSVDTVSGNKNLQKSILLTTSPYGRRVKSPSSVSLENINNPPARALFNDPFIPVGVLIEGIFPSTFQNRLTENLGYPSDSLVYQSLSTKMIVIADAGMIANKVNYSSQPPQISELGYDRVSKQTFGNKDFLLNAVHYLNDGSGIMQLRGRTIKLRLLDQVRLREEKAFWQWLNVLGPMVLVTFFALGYTVVRKFRYSRS